MSGTVSIRLLIVLALTQTALPPIARAVDFQHDVRPILENYCYDCHADGADKGGVAFDKFNPEASPAASRDLWFKALKNLRSGLMPPAKKAQPTAAEKQIVLSWIKTDIFGTDPQNPDPGRVTVRRLNRVEYHNTIRDLLGVDYDTQSEFPPDDTGNGFDNNGDVLTLSPTLLEKYLNAAQEIISQVVPVTSTVIAEKVISGQDLAQDGQAYKGALSFSYYEPGSVADTFHIDHAGRYQLVLNLSANERFVDDQFDYNRCRFIFSVDGHELLRNDYNREAAKVFRYVFDQQWTEGDHQILFQVQPLPPAHEQLRALNLRINSVTLRGPYDEKYYVTPANYQRFFPKDVPPSAAARRAYARELLAGFAGKAFRRPPDDQDLNRLVKLAESVYSQPRQTFETGIAQAMVAVLASPRFLFRQETLEPVDSKTSAAPVDEYSLASRLSYFLWSSMPDDELIQQAAAGTLRKNLDAQVRRMLADPRSDALTKNFGGQWLQTRDITIVPIKAGAVLARDGISETNRIAMSAVGPGHKDFEEADLDMGLRYNFQSEADLYFGYIMHQDRDVAEFVDSDYTFLNGRLARVYGLGELGIHGEELRKVTLPSDSPRGGVLTMGSVLAVTSNPTRTSPVKRGLFILDNILGTPSPPPPPNIPPLENAESTVTSHPATLREALSVHRTQPMCASCHDRLDPPGLALENFNAIGIWRDTDRGQAIETTGQLATGETFHNVRELKHILATQHRADFYRCLTEKMLTYALGRGLEYYDVETVDQIVARLQQNDGRFSALVTGVVESAPFEKSRTSVTMGYNQSPKSPEHFANRNSANEN
jgi:hypothetical protein